MSANPMNEFRKALDDHLAGQASLETVDRVLHEGLSQQPGLAAAYGALVEALYRSDRIPGETYLALIKSIHAFQQTQTHWPPAPKPQPADEEASDRTILRAVTSKSTSEPAPVESAEDPDKTQFRIKPAPAPPVARNDDGDKTQYRIKPSPVTGVGVQGGDKTQFRTPPHHTTPRDITTGSSWSDPSRWTSTDSTPLGPGSVIKDRFVLEDQIGRGGMGTVFKARDLRKEEAQDRNPYVAIKILNEEFKRHPQSLQALQREARKAQALAHPNIVTVYDFDRDGTNVFMVMELLEGESLDRVIKRNEGLGLGIKDALNITRDVCKAMAYAHEQGIVHADFKPANAFLTKSGVAKVFDFGIARAVKRGDQVGGSQTLFDPGTLGALTPAYASCEVIDGEEPDARDDVYAIACVVYELLTGTHPYNRMSAAQARAANVIVNPPVELSRRQWRALQRGLGFRRETRQATATKFLEDFLPRRITPVMYAAGAAAGVAVLVLGGMLTSTLITTYNDRSMAKGLASAEADRIEELLPQLRELEPTRRAAVFLDETARAGLIRYFEERINLAIDSKQRRYDYPRAETLLTQLSEFFPDSQAVKDIRDRLATRKSDEIKQQSDWLDFYLKRGILIPAQESPNVTSVLAIVKQIDPTNRLLSDPRLPGAFAEQIRQALLRQDTRLAEALVAAGAAMDPSDATLTDLKDQVKRATGAQKDAARRTYLEKSLSGLLTAPLTLAALERQRAPLNELRAIDPRSAVLLNIQAAAQKTLDEQTNDLLKRRELGQAQQLIARAADLVSPAFIVTKRQQLAAAQKADDDPKPETPNAPVQPAAAVALAEPDAVGKLAVADLKAQVAAGLAKPRLTLSDARKLSAMANELTKRGDAEGATASKQIRIHLANDANAMKNRRGIEDAIQFAEGAYGMFPDSPVLKKTLFNLRVVAAQRAAQQRDVSVTEIKGSIDELLDSRRIDDTWPAAIEMQFRRLSAFLPDSDPYVNQAKARAATLYVKRAGALRAQQRFTEAERMLERARGYAPGSTEFISEEKLLADARLKQDQDDKVRNRAAALIALKQKLLVQAQANEVVDAQLSLQELRATLPAKDPFVTKDGPSAIADAYLRMASSAAKDGRFENAVTLADRARDIFKSPEVSSIRRRFVRYEIIEDMLSERFVIDGRAIRRELDEFAVLEPAEVAAVRQVLARRLVARINSLKSTEQAGKLSAVAREAFPNDFVMNVSAQGAAADAATTSQTPKQN